LKVLWGAAASATEETCSSQGGVFMEIRVLATREVGLVIIKSRSITDVGDLELTTSSKLEVTAAENMTGIEIGPLVDSS